LSLERVLAGHLCALGVRTAFGVTGSGSSWKLITALEDLGAEYLPAGHEAAAAIMAGGAWRATGRLSVAVGIKGPGLANMLAGIAFNHFENLPVVSACEAYGRAAPPQRMHKRMNQTAMLSAVCKGSIALAEGAARLSALVDLANDEVPGPVHVDLCEGPSESVPWQPAGAGPVATPAETSAALSLVERAQRPILVVGSLALRRGWGRTLDALRIPIFTTAAAKGAVNEAGPSSLGVYTGDGRSATPEAVAFADCDLVVGLGLRNLEVLTPKAFGVPLLWLDEADPRCAQGFGADILWHTRDSAAYERVLAMLAARHWGEDQVAESRHRLARAAPAAEWLPAACFRVLDSFAAPCSMAVDTGSFCTIAEHYWRASATRRYFGSSNARFMGGSIPTAIGAAAADRATPVFCVCGDGGIRMYFAEIALAVRYRLPICFVLMSDGRFGSVVNVAPGAALSDSAVSTPRTSWLQPVEGLGCQAVAAADAQGFEEAVRSWSADAPLYVECRFAPEPYAAMTGALR
jgi:acetolactate synthase-1/2/3 large subunit